MQNRRNKQYRQYDVSCLTKAAQMVTQNHFTIYRAAKEVGVPWSTLKGFLIKDNITTAPKLDRPFALTSELEVKLYKYIIKMQEIGFGLSVRQIREVAFKLANDEGRQNFMNPDKEEASKWWWTTYKKRYNLGLRVSENLAGYRASMANPIMIDDYFQNLNNLLVTLNIQGDPSRLFNCDETGLSYVEKGNKVVTAIGKRYVYNRIYADRGETTTVLGCISADGTWIPPLIIFKGQRWIPSLRDDALPQTLIKVSEKGWITSAIFLEWFEFFINSVASERPVVLLMDSYAAHVTPEIITMAAANQIFLFTFPAHSSHLLQPLDVGVYKPLKSYWRQSIKNYMITYPDKRPNRYTFNAIFTPAFISAFSSVNIKQAFKKAGVHPFDRKAIPNEALAPSTFTEKGSVFTNPLPVAQSLTIPSSSGTAPTIKRRTKDSSAKCLNSSFITSQSLNNKKLSSSAFNKIGDNVKISNPGLSRTPLSSHKSNSSKLSIIKTTNHIVKNKKEAKINKTMNEEDWDCGICGKSFSLDDKLKNGAKWVQCSFCFVPYHVKCQSSETDKIIFMCDMCSVLDSN